MSNECDDLIKAFLEADLASQPELTSFTAYPSLAEMWRAACNERQAVIQPSWYTYLLDIMDFN